MRKLVVSMLLAALVAAPQSKSKHAAQKKAAEDAQDDSIPQFTAPVTNILAPTRVFDRARAFITGIRGDEFHLYDNGKEQTIHVDESLVPLSMVIAIQCNHEVDRILPQVNKIGNMVGPLLLGAQGEAAVIAFDSRVRVLQDFTSDGDKISDAVAKIHGGSLASRLVDAVDEGEHLLRTRSANRQKVILLISETRDEGSQLRGRETLDYLQANNVTVYIVTMSRVLGKLTAPAQDPQPDTLPPAMHPMPAGVPATPTSVAQTYGGPGYGVQFTPLITEIYKDLKAFMKAPAADVFRLATGGSKYDFYRGKGLEDALQQMAAELHLEYLLSYSPNNKSEGGWHDIRVEVTGHGQAQVKTRPGYWMVADSR